MKTLVEENENLHDKAFSISANSEVFMSAYDSKNAGTKSPTFVMGQDKEINDFVQLEGTSHFNVENSSKDTNIAKLEDDIVRNNSKRQD